jgi:predicted Rossmann fold nucleotide-binding protein DprA/Smf involved in DNA uptake
MNPEQPAEAPAETKKQSTWAVRWSEFPPAQGLASECETIQGMGDREILRHRRLGLICSVQCPGSVVIKTFDAIRELRDAGVVVIGGFHSPMEQECLDFLLRGEQPVIICPARGIGRPRLPAPWRKAVDAGRLLVLSPFGDKVVRPTKVHAQRRNEFVAAISAAVFIPYAAPGGKVSQLARTLLASATPVFVLGDDHNRQWIECGAAAYDLDTIKSRLAAGKQNERVR